MPIYHRLGEIPPKRHQVMPRDDGSMHFEQLIGNKGFVGLRHCSITSITPPKSTRCGLSDPARFKLWRTRNSVTAISVPTG